MAMPQRRRRLRLLRELQRRRCTSLLHIRAATTEEGVSPRLSPLLDSAQLPHVKI